MKICFLTNDIFTLGGVQRVVSVIANELVKNKNIDVTILCTAKGCLIDREIYNLDKRINIDIDSVIFKKKLIEKSCGKIIRIINDKFGIFNNEKMLKISKKVYISNKIRKRLIDYINNNDFDVVIAVEGLFAMYLGSISDEIKCRTIGWQHNSIDAYFNTKNKYYWNQDVLFKYTAKKLDKYIVLTDNDKYAINEKFGINAERIYNPLSFKCEKKSNLDMNNILFVGRIAKRQKGIDILLKSFKIICEKNKNWNLNIVGDGPDKEELEQLAVQLKIEDRVKFISFTSNVEKFYLKASIFVSSSRWEGFGLVLTEAMECGVPVIAFNNSGPKEIISKNGVNGILIKNKTVEDLAEGIMLLINNETLRSNIAKESIKRAKDYYAEYVVKEWLRLIRE
ncbi:glycosyltransferase family 4 protein [Clostridium perfringens]|uniref:glycosyltransferase family 4 protein n=1 Tax=Clostridium perfringens TaxID=1502 RepID=UPI0024BC4F5A|nr:glycosyltransferase family 4 protein [Clostridium perfringens]EIF6290828.1 glycosyltransferase family 4 protein [Clostridium perfringens]EJT6535189.1 glycosyltransferase family 4 protein [Clostridium perfringens]MDM0780557.1 glycosyltransferase family 4 protein [Clostridium perfringens]MDM0792885.1 glycosyltransferase family 4 protein [Clostridium perfringens]MDM0816031.1 glycosyltransferase family 4 protein [Clostridium perfringens]